MQLTYTAWVELPTGDEFEEPSHCRHLLGVSFITSLNTNYEQL